MKIAYLDCFAGISGDMMLGALVDAGLNIDALRSELDKLRLTGFRIEAERQMRRGITGTKVTVVTEEQKAHRHLSHIREILQKSDLAAAVKSQSLAVFECLAEAEAKVHNTTLEKIHFHEVGALDAIVDVVGAVAGLELLGIEKLLASPVSTGTGFVDCEHGRMPVPAPATAEILKGVPLRATPIEAELTTPTGAAILKTLAVSFGPPPAFTICEIGYGVGYRDLEIPNLLRLLVGDEADAVWETDRVELIEANIDDMPPERFEYIMTRLLDDGALDVWITPILMKKSRPGHLLSLLCGTDSIDGLLSIIFRETSTIGVRTLTVDRRKLPRETIEVKTEWGSARVKVARMGGTVCNLAPEYDDCRRLAEANSIPLKQVFETVQATARTKLGLNATERTE